jgi:hypothetical protein
MILRRPACGVEEYQGKEDRRVGEGKADSEEAKGELEQKEESAQWKACLQQRFCTIQGFRHETVVSMRSDLRGIYAKDLRHADS